MENKPVKKFLTKTQALQRLQKYCAFQERSQYEARNKLLQLGQRGNDLENIIVTLIEENFLNEERFALSYARGKFRMKNWGRNKIIQELKRKKISDYCIHKAMKEIDGSNYKKTLLRELEKKSATIVSGNIFTRKQKLSSYLIRKGYEPDMVWEAVGDYFSE